MIERWACDFETYPNPHETYVWIWGAQNVETGEFIHGSNINSFIDWSLEYNKHLYFHNLKFDGNFIASALFGRYNWEYVPKNPGNCQFSAVISKQGKWYCMEMRKGDVLVKIFDSYKKLPFSLDVIAKAWDLGVLKGSIDYTKYREEGHTPTDEELEYLKGDCDILARALKILFSQKLSKMTIGSDALNTYKKMMGKYFDYYFPKLSPECDAHIRKSYKGGWCYLNQEGEHGEGIVLDVNSLYPYAMTQLLPYGKPKYFKGKPETSKRYPLYTIRFVADFKLKEGMLPTIQLKNQPHYFVGTEYIKDSKGPKELCLTSIDFKLFLEHYKIFDDIQYLDGYCFKAKEGMFKEYIDHWSSIKENNTGAIRQTAKLMLNNLYGKFSKNPDITRKDLEFIDGIVKERRGEYETGETIYIPIGSFITAQARNVTIRAAQANYERFIYADTDSLHLIGKQLPELNIHDSKLGCWAHECDFTRSRHIRAKRYILTIKGNGGECFDNPVCAGLPANCKLAANWENFTDGMVFTGKLVPKAVKGGVYLEATTFTMD